MNPQSYESLAAYILTVDKTVLGFLLPLSFFLAVALVATISKERRPLELVAMTCGLWVLVFLLATVVFHFVLHRPFLRLEIVQFPFLMELGLFFGF